MPWEQDYSFPPHPWHSSGFTKAGKARSCLLQSKPPPLLVMVGPASTAVPVTAPSRDSRGTSTYSLHCCCWRAFCGSVWASIFHSLGTYRISPFFSEPPFPSLKADSLDAVALLVSVFQACNPSCQERVLARLPWVMPYPFPAPRLWTSFSFPLSNQTFTVEELGMDSPSLCCPRGRASAGGNLQCLLQKRFLASF